MHRNVTMRFLTCEPNLEANETTETPYLDEADRFFSNNTRWFLENRDSVASTTRLVIYESLYKQLWNSKNGFIKNFLDCDKFFHSPIKESERVDYYIYVCSSKSVSSKKIFQKAEL